LLFFVLGLPGQFATWCEGILARLAGHDGDAVAAMVWPSLDEILKYEPVPSPLAELGDMLIKTEARHLVIGARWPGEALHRALLAGNLPFLLAIDDPRNAVADTVTDAAVEPRSAVRAVVNSCVYLSQYDGLPSALVLDPDQARHQPAEAVAAISAHFGLALTPETAQSIAKDAAPNWASASPKRGEELIAGAGADVGKMIDGALMAHCERFRGGPLGQFVWTRDLFIPGSLSNLHAPIDVASSGRVLVYGPYIQLPVGSWAAEIVIGFSAQACGASFLVDVFSGNQLAFTVLRPMRAGVYTANLTFSIGALSDNGIEVRIMVESEKAAGHIAFGHVVLRPLVTHLSEPAAPAEGDFTSVLAL